jgi:hypothetical protein
MTIIIKRVPSPGTLEDMATRVKGATLLTPMGRESLATISNAFERANEGNYKDMLIYKQILHFTL